MASNNPYAPYPNQYAAAPSSGYNSAVHTPDAQNMQNNMARLQMMAAQYQQQQQQQALLAALAAQNPVQLAQQRQQYMVLQQAQMDVQMRQLQMAQLAMQQNQAQQQQQALLMQQQQQQEQQATQSAQIAAAARHSRAVSASPVIEHRPLQSWTSNTGSDPLPAPSASRVAAARELSSLQTRANRHSMLPSPLSPVTPASDWQAKRMSFPASRNVSAPLQCTYAVGVTNAGVTNGTNISANDDNAISLTSSVREHHRKTSSLASANSAASSNSVCSPNRGPALVLSVPGEEVDDNEGSMEVNDSIITHDVDVSLADVKQAKRQSRHTVILSSQLPPAAGLAAAAKELHQRRASQSSTVSVSDKDSQPSSGNSSPTSDHSDIVSFDSNETGHTSLEEASPTKSGSSNGLAIESTPRAPTGKSLNPSAIEFSPPSADIATPQGRPASSRLRSGSPPAVATGAVTVTILRQPRGPADESELASKNFAGVIRRKAVGALRLAASGGNNSRLPAPLASPLVEQFANMGLGRPVPALASLNTGNQALYHGRAVTSPNVAAFLTTTPQQEAFSASASPSTFADFGAQLAQRAMKRRSAQLAAGNSTPTTASQPMNYGLGMYQQC